MDVKNNPLNTAHPVVEPQRVNAPSDSIKAASEGVRAELPEPSSDHRSAHRSDRVTVSTGQKGKALPLLSLKASTAETGNIELGRSLGKATDNPQEALRLARRIPYLWDDQDMAIVQQPNGQYQVFELERSPGVFDDDLDNYQELRALNPAQISGEPRLFAIMGDDKSLRFLQPQPGPAYQRPGNAPPILPASAGTEQRQQRVALLQKEFTAVAERLTAMAQDLGASGDHRGIFTNLYNVTTQSGIQEVQRLVDAGKWREAEFLGSLCIDFANRYFDAYDAYTQGPIENVPEAWRNAFDLGRQAQDTGILKGSVSKVLGLSIVAHIINDLPQTLQSIGYPDAEDRDSTLRETYDFFDAALMEQKENIMGALATHYGVSDTLILDTIAEQLPFDVNSTSQKELFSLMRDTARVRAETLSQAQIKEKAVTTGDWVRRLVPGLS